MRDINSQKSKQLPNYQTSGKLLEDTNMMNGVILKYVEPQERSVPSLHWRLHVFKDNNQIDVIPIYEKSHYLVGRERRVANISVDHPSCSSQHAVIQFRKLYGKIKPYIIDLESSNGTKINQNTIPTSRYVELFPKDVIQFGFSTREYVVLYEEMTNK